jgi:hypothetical protein
MFPDDKVTYIDSYTYDIVSPSFKSDRTFKVDTLCAPLVSLLNKNGIRTSFSCQGHYYISKTDDNPKCSVIDNVPVIEQCGEYKDYIIFDGSGEDILAPEPYIMFNNYMHQDINKRIEKIIPPTWYMAAKRCNNSLEKNRYKTIGGQYIALNVNVILVDSGVKAHFLTQNYRNIKGMVYHESYGELLKKEWSVLTKTFSDYFK